MKTDWNETIAFAEKGLFGDVKIEQPDGHVRQGPLESINRDGNRIIIEARWMAGKQPGGQWKKHPDRRMTLEADWQPHWEPGGIIEVLYVNIPGGGRVFLYDKEDSEHSLDPSEVYGLDADQLIPETRPAA